MSRETEYGKVRPGTLLIAEPHSVDAYFRRSVVLIASHEPQGTYGFIVNKRLNLSLGEMIDDFPSGPYIPGLGGPVRKSTLNYIHRLGDGIIPNSYRLADGIYWGGDYDRVRQLIRTGDLAPHEIKFFLGSAGWDEDQLYNEFVRGDWGAVYIDDLDIIDASDDLWYEAVESSNEYRPWALIPEDPADN